MTDWDKNRYVTKEEANERIQGAKKIMHTRIAFAGCIFSIFLGISYPWIGIPLFILCFYWEIKNHYWGPTEF
jgi:hypothetical protein